MSKLTEKFQATIPAEVRKTLKLHKGDSIVFDVQNDQTVIVRKALQGDLEWAKAIEGTLSEWESPNDEAAYGDL